MKPSLIKGFSILELIIAISIFVVLTTVLLANYNSINQRLTLDTLAHQMAQWIRETQVSAMSVRAHAGGFKQGFGLHFDTAQSTQFIYFADLPGGTSKRYDPIGTGLSCGADTVECVQLISLLRGNTIERICGATPLPTYAGSCPNGFDELSMADVVFMRPDPDATIWGVVAGNPQEYGHISITLRSLFDHRRTISVWTTGQVTVQ